MVCLPVSLLVIFEICSNILFKVKEINFLSLMIFHWHSRVCWFLLVIRHPSSIFSSVRNIKERRKETLLRSSCKMADETSYATRLIRFNVGDSHCYNICPKKVDEQRESGHLSDSTPIIVAHLTIWPRPKNGRRATVPRLRAAIIYGEFSKLNNGRLKIGWACVGESAVIYKGRGSHFRSKLRQRSRFSLGADT